MPLFKIHRIDAQWNHFHSCRPIFVDKYIFTISLGHLFTSNWVVAFVYIVKMIQHSIIRSWGCKFEGKNKPRNPRILIPNKQ